MSRKALIIALVLLVLGLEVWNKYQNTRNKYESSVSSIHEAFEQGLTDIQINGIGQVKKVLPDDLDGSRHQRFILDVGNSLSILVAHNIDLADKIDSLRRGDLIEYMGEYEWTSKGGVIHWTHHDPRGKHLGGWLKHNGVIYE